MAPRYLDGDWVLVGVSWPIRPDVIVLAQDPRGTGRLLVKRAVRRVASGWWVEGDNRAASTDSRHFGAIPPELVLGRVLFRYHRPPVDDR